MAKQNKVFVYSTEWCPWCHKAKEWLDNNKIPYEDRDVEKNAGYAEEMQQKSQQTSIPVIDINGTIIIGYNEAAMKKALGI